MTAAAAASRCAADVGPGHQISIDSCCTKYKPPKFWSDCTVHTHTRPFNGPLSGTTRVSRYKKGKTNLDFTETRDSEWQWHQLGHMHTSLQSDNHASTPLLSFLQAGCPSCRPTNSVKALKAVGPTYLLCGKLKLHLLFSVHLRCFFGRESDWSRFQSRVHNTIAVTRN